MTATADNSPLIVLPKTQEGIAAACTQLRIEIAQLNKGLEDHTRKVSADVEEKQDLLRFLQRRCNHDFRHGSSTCCECGWSRGDEDRPSIGYGRGD